MTPRVRVDQNNEESITGISIDPSYVLIFLNNMAEGG